MVSEVEIEYVVWQNRAFRFYLASRLLYQNEQYSPSAFCAIQSLESLMKATLVYWDKSFDPEATNHKIAGMVQSIRNKVKEGKTFSCPEYFYLEKRFQSVTRYPAKGKGVLLPASFLVDLDSVFSSLVCLVPFQFNTNLKHALSGKVRRDLNILRRNNHQIRQLRKFLKVNTKK